MKKENIYSTKNVMQLLAIFVAIFWLLYSLGSFLHESQKIRREIEKIQTENELRRLGIREKKQRLEYLKTSERIDKEAKMQMGRKQPGEKVLVLIEEKLKILPTEKKKKSRIIQPEIPIWEKWKWVFFHE